MVVNATLSCATSRCNARSSRFSGVARNHSHALWVLAGAAGSCPLCFSAGLYMQRVARKEVERRIRDPVTF